MMKKYLVAAGLMVTLFGAMMPLAAEAATSPGPATKKSCTSSFLGFPAWYEGLAKPPDCQLMSPADLDGPENTKIARYIWKIALNVLEVMLMLVLYVSVGFVIYGGFRYITSAGDSGGVASAKKTILNAIIGLVLSFMSIAIVNLIAGNIK